MTKNVIFLFMMIEDARSSQLIKKPYTLYIKNTAIGLMNTHEKKLLNVLNKSLNYVILTSIITCSGKSGTYVLTEALIKDH